jgi:uncharacterized protein involved in exopolysaccharide biosynthesis
VSSHHNKDPAGDGGVLPLLFRKTWAIAISTVAAGIAAGLIAWILPKQYTATTEVSPVDYLGGGRESGLNSLMSQVSGLASLAISTPAATAREESLATLQSTTLTERFIDANNLLPVLFARSWNPVASHWRNEPPTLWKANRYFATHVRSVVENKKSGLVTLSITWTDPELAARWANGLVELTNDYLRTKAIADSERDIAYLRDEVTKTNAVEIQKAIYSLMETEYRKAMLAKGGQEFALKIIDRAFAPENPSSPQPLLWLGAGLSLGFLASLAVILAGKRTDERDRATS